MKIISQNSRVRKTLPDFEILKFFVKKKLLAGNYFVPILLVILSLLFRNETAFAQHTDHVAGDILVMLKKGSEVNEVVKTFSLLNGKETGLKAEQNLSQRLNIWK